MDIARENGRRRHRLAVVAVATLAFLSACGGGIENFGQEGQGGNTPGSAASPTSIFATPTPTQTPGRPAAIHFVGAQPAAIGVRGSGLPEQATLTFQVADSRSNPVGGAAVTFTLSGVGDESIDPTHAVTDSEGLARTTLTSGIRATTVRIVAGVDSDGNGSLDLSAQSTAVAVFGAPPSQNRFGIAVQHLNVAGRVLFGIENTVSVYANDQFGNAVPAGTAVSFTSNGASVVNPTMTNSGGVATATLLTENNIPPTGIVTVMAYTRGQETFTDNNGNGIFDEGDTILTDDVPEPFIDFRPLPGLDASCPIDPPSPLCNDAFDADDPFELFVDANNNGVWDPQGTTGQWDNDILISQSIPVTFSGPLVNPVVSPSSFTIYEGGSQTFILEVHDDLLNPLVGGSTVTVTSSSDKVKVTGGSFTIPDGESFNQIVDGLNRFAFVLSDATDDMDPVATGCSIIVSVTSQNGNGSFVVASGVVDVPPVVSTPTPTATPETPAIAPDQATLSAGDGAPPNNCNGGSQTFVVTGGSPPFSIFGGGGCINIATVPVSGGSFIYTAGNLVGGYAITVTDAIGRTASINVTVQGPPTPTAPPTGAPTVTATPTPAAAHIQLALFVNQASDNGDGTLSSVVSALVTDATGASVQNGVPVQFSLVEPLIAGVSVTSPGVTGSAPPCTLGFPVVAQPGDALSCVKYDRARSGQTVTIQAVVQTPSGPLTSTQTITLPGAAPAAAHLQLALFVNQASDNGDGTLSSVISALVTDVNGAVVVDGVPVQFSLVAPVLAGVSVTSPGLTGRAAPCTLGFPVIAQPGDALSCVKYDKARQGQPITVQAVVPTSGGSLTTTQAIALPDLRTSTPTNTPTATATSTPSPPPTPTPTPTLPLAAHIQLTLFNQANNNNDGTLTTVVSALVTDVNGVVINDGAPVAFSVIAPVAGVSVTSPGIIGQAAPCSLCFPVPAQPGDALSCVKYDGTRQGQTLQIRATVQTPTGPLSDTRDLILPAPTCQ